MASEYLKQKYKDVKPDAPVELTKEEKRKNWWYYNKWYVAAAGVLVLILAGTMWDILQKKANEPDYQVAYVGEQRLPDDTVSAIEACFAGLAPDRNGDGKTLVLVRQYVSSPDGDPSAVAAAGIQLMADIMEHESFLFLLEDPESFQQNYHALSRLDGSLPEEEDFSVDSSVLTWSQCPVLQEMELGDFNYDLFGGTISGSSQELLSQLFIGRRGFWTEEEPADREGYTALWETLTEGAEF